MALKKHELLKFGDANDKMRPLESWAGVRICTFQMPAGKYGKRLLCPGAKDCLSWVVEGPDGRRTVHHGPDQRYTCYASTMAARYTATWELQKHNFLALDRCRSVTQVADLFLASWEARKPRANVMRALVSSDWYNRRVLEGFYVAMSERPDRHAYFYTKNIPLLLATADRKPANVSVTASLGGKFDALALKHGIRWVQVYGSEAEAAAAGVEVDKDDRHAFEINRPTDRCFHPTMGGEPFGLIVHGVQQKGTWGSEKLAQLRRKDKVHHAAV